MRMAMGNAALGTIILTASAGGTHAALIEGFESYTLTDPTDTTSPYTNGLAGQGGWSASSNSSSNGRVVATTPSGEYTGGKAVTGSHTSSNAEAGWTYIGGRAGTLLSDNAFSFDFQWTGTNTNSTTLGGECYVGGWIDAAAVGTFANAEAGFMVGQVRDTAASKDYFGIRGAGFGDRIFTSVSGTAGNWYRMVVQISGATTVTLSARNLTTASVVDLNGAAVGTDYTTTLTSAQFGGATSSYTGVMIRSTGLTAVDNITAGVPEPSALALAGIAGVSLLGRRKRRA